MLSSYSRVWGGFGVGKGTLSHPLSAVCIQNIHTHIHAYTFYILIMHYMANIDDELCIINHRILRYIRAVEHDNLLHTKS